jgi:hypothetical protein
MTPRPERESFRTALTMGAILVGLVAILGEDAADALGWPGWLREALFWLDLLAVVGLGLGIARDA